MRDIDTTLFVNRRNPDNKTDILYHRYGLSPEDALKELSRSWWIPEDDNLYKHVPEERAFVIINSPSDPDFEGPKKFVERTTNKMIEKTKDAFLDKKRDKRLNKDDKRDDKRRDAKRPDKKNDKDIQATNKKEYNEDDVNEEETS